MFAWLNSKKLQTELNNLEYNDKRGDFKTKYISWIQRKT